MAHRVMKHRGAADEQTVQRSKNQAAIRLLQKWVADDSGYDESVWPGIKKAIEANPLSARRRFHD